MKLSQIRLARIKKIQTLTPIIVVIVLMVVGAVIYNLNARAAAGPGFYFTASDSSYQVEQHLQVGVYENSEADCANVVQANFTYPVNLLRYDSTSASGSKFESSIATNSGNGTVEITQYTTRKECGNGSSVTSGVSGNQLIATVNFTVIGQGEADLNFKDDSIAVSSIDNSSNVAPNTESKHFTFTAATASPSPTPTPSPEPEQDPEQDPEQSEPEEPEPVISITPDDTDTPISLVDNEVVELDSPADIQPLPVQPDGVKKIEYYLNGKLVATVNTEPYKYHLDTDKLLNGDYRLTTKTYYDNGQTKSVSQTIVVKNPFGWTQVRLRLQKSVWLITIITLVLIAAVIAWFVHKRGGGSFGGYDDGYTVPDEGVVGGTVVTPSGTDSGDGSDWQPLPKK